MTSERAEEVRVSFVIISSPLGYMSRAWCVCGAKVQNVLPWRARQFVQEHTSEVTRG